MLVVDVSINPEQALQDGFGHRHEILGKGNSCGTEDVENADEDHVLFQCLSAYVIARLIELLLLAH